MDLIEPPPAELDAAGIMWALRDGVDGRGSAVGAGDALRSRTASAQWNRVYQHVTEAERHAAIGTVVPALKRFHPIVRPVARAMAACVIYGGRFVITPQRLFNIAALRVVRSLADCLSDADARVDTSEARIDKLEETVTAQSKRIETLTRAIESQSGDRPTAISEAQRASGNELRRTAC